MPVENISAEANPHFTKVFNETKQSIEFSKDWSDGKGRFGPATIGPRASIIRIGDIVKSISPGGRRILFVGTRLGNLVVYDRFVKQAPGEDNYETAVISRDATPVLENGGWFAEYAFDDYEIVLALGGYFEGSNEYQVNLGLRIEQLFQNLKVAA